MENISNNTQVYTKNGARNSPRKYRKEAITINGNIGAGKGTVATMLASILKYQYLSTGNFFRQDRKSVV